MTLYGTGCKTLDELIGGGIPSGGMSTVFSSKNLGKTLLSLQIGTKFSIDTGKPVLYLETEGFFIEPMVKDKYLTFLGKRFNGKPNIDIMYLSNAFDFSRMLGRELELVRKEKKLEVMQWLVQLPENSKLAQMIKEKDYGMIIVDSFSDPCEDLLASQIKQLPERKNLVKPLLGALKDIGAKLDIPIFLTVHESKNPANPYDTGKPILGDTYGYAVKTVIQIRYTKDKNNRKFVLVRAPGIMETKTEPVVLGIKEDYGFVDGTVD